MSASSRGLIPPFGCPLRILRTVRGILPNRRLERQMCMDKGRAIRVTKVKTTCTYCGVGCSLT